MTFKRTELIAIMSMANAMIMADGRIDDAETSVISVEMLKFGIPLEDFKEIYTRGMNMEPDIAVDIVSKMTYEQKKYVAAYLGTLMASDKDINDKELALWRLLSKLCGLPSMNITDAVEYMQGQ